MVLAINSWITIIKNSQVWESIHGVSLILLTPHKWTQSGLVGFE